MGIVRASEDSCNNAVENERAIRVAACPPSVQRVGDGGRDGEDASHQRLRAQVDLEVSPVLLEAMQTPPWAPGGRLVVIEVRRGNALECCSQSVGHPRLMPHHDADTC